jgi:CheY-like chemotaxis protein
MKALLDDLLDMARVAKGLATLQKQTIDIRAIVAEAVEQSMPLIQARRHQLDISLPPEAMPVSGDRKRLIQIVVNLLNNAAKYTPDDGHIEVNLRARDDEIELQVSDDGIGMRAEVVVRVFDLFAQAERASDRAQGGLGLGLALVKGLVGLHGGNVAAYSKGLGQGSTFTVRLPRLKQSSSIEIIPTNPNAPVPASASPARVMLVDDNADAANTLQMFLMAAGHDVAVEYHPLQAIERAREIAPRICLLDIGLPDMDGIELARQLKAIPETASSVFIAVSGYGQERDKKKSLEAGFDYHLVKPIDANKLLGLLADIKLAPF